MATCLRPHVCNTKQKSASIQTISSKDIMLIQTPQAKCPLRKLQMYAIQASHSESPDNGNEHKSM